MGTTTADSRGARTIGASRTLVDVAIAAAACAGTLALLRHGGLTPTRPGSADLDATGIVLAVCSTLPLLAWRRFPLGVFLTTAAASALLAGLGYPLDPPLGAAIALYLMAAGRSPGHPALIAAGVVAMLAATLIASAAAHHTFPGTELLHTGLAWAVAWFAGDRTRLRRIQITELSERATRAEQATQRERRLAVAEERASIARDLHDSAGHAISLIAIRAGTARLRHPQHPDRSLQALAAVEDLARQTVDEIDRLVAVLRHGAPATNSVEAPAGLASLDTLIAHHTAAGMNVAVTTLGTPRRLGGTADQAAYRILQEALTNAAQHGTDSARIHIAFEDTAVQLTITNPLPERVNGASRVGGGLGLIGMQERASLLGGSFHAGPAADTFRLDARIPYEGHRP